MNPKGEIFIKNNESTSFLRDFFAVIGYNASKSFGRFFSKIGTGLMFFVLILAEILRLIIKVLHFISKELTDSFRNRIALSRKLQAEVNRAKKDGDEKKYRQAKLNFILSFVFGEDGVLYTAFNYIMPVVSTAFLIGVIKYGSGLEYGLEVTYNGKNLGVVAEEADYEKAEREVYKKINFADGETISIPASFVLKTISESDEILTSRQLSDKMLKASDEELTNAYGIYIDGEFLCAVKNTKPIEDALSERLLNYKVVGSVKDVSYQNKIEYIDGIYLTDSIEDEKDVISLLTSSTAQRDVYVVESGDTPVSICLKYNMDIETFRMLNPSLESNCTAGQIVYVFDYENYLPIQYIRELDSVSFLGYETIQTETSSLNVGTKSVLIKGEQGEKTSHIEITYVDGIERSRNIISSQVTKEPVMEVIGVGTYSAKPDSLEDTRLTGTGEFSWPVDGGWISDVFISDRNHKGLDIASDMGTSIYASADGVVVSAGWNWGGYGYVVMIDHLNGYQTVYAHMSEVFAKRDQRVSRGQLIGAMGSTGDSTGPHCHFEVRYMGVCYNPADYLNTVNYSESELNEAKKKEANNP